MKTKFWREYLDVGGTKKQEAENMVSKGTI
jgi:hypothetical protein